MSGKPSLEAEIAGKPETDGMQDAWLPESGQIRRVLRERAQLFAQQNVADEAVLELEPYIRFRLGAQEHYGIPYAHVEEIMDADGICPVPCTPAFIKGVRNRRGEMLTVLDLKEFFRPVHDEDYAEDALIIVVSAKGIQAGVLVNEVIGNDEFVVNKLDTPLPTRGVRDLQHLRGIYRGQVAVLNMDSLFSDPVLNVGKPVGKS